MAALTFAAAYSGALHPLRHLASRSSAHIATAVKSRRPIKNFSEFWRDVGPAVLLHGQGFMVAVVSSGFAKGSVDGYLAQQERNVMFSGDPNESSKLNK